MKTRILATVGQHIVLGTLCLGFMLPVISLLKQAFWDSKSALLTRAFAMVAELTLTTIHVAMIAVVISLVIGCFAAWAVTSWQFRGRNIISILLCLPFALPTYLVAGIYRSLHWAYPTLMPSPEGVIGAGVVFGLTLFPWVYVPMKMQLAVQSTHYDDLGRSLGLGPWRRLFNIRLGLLAPTLGLVSLLVLMDVISDFGTVSMLGVKTISVGIHDAMFSMYRRDWAAQLSLLGLLLPIMSVLLFTWACQRRKTYQPTNRWRAARRKQASRLQQVALCSSLGGILVLTFLLPITILLRWALLFVGRIPLAALPSQITNSVLVTLVVAVLTLLLAVMINLMLRFKESLRGWRPIAILANLNYAMPTVMLAVSVLFMSTMLPRSLTSLLLSESVALLVIAGALTYTCFPFFSFSAGLENISPRIDDLCRVVGIRGRVKLMIVYFPMLKHSLAAGFLLVVVNMLKELNLSQVLHPFGFQSLSMRLFSFAGMSMVEESALFGLVLISLSIYPVVSLDRLLNREGLSAC